MVHNSIWIKEEPERKEKDKFYWWVKTLMRLEEKYLCVILIYYIIFDLL